MARRYALVDLEDNDCLLLGHAALSPTPDWRAKVEWLLAEGLQPSENYGLCTMFPKSLPPDAADMTGAALVERLRWLKAQGFKLCSQVVWWLLRDCGDEPEVSQA